MNKSIFFLANQAAMLLDCFAFLCNLIPLLLNLKYTAKQEKIKCVMIYFIMNDAQELLLSLNEFCFSTRRKLFIWLLVLLMPFEFQFVFLVINIIFSNFVIHFYRGLLNYAFGKGWTFVLDIHIDMMFPFQSTHNILRYLINILVPC
jgi:hypothetical protein